MKDFLCTFLFYGLIFQASLERGASQEEDREQEVDRRRERREEREDLPSVRGHRGGYREPPGLGGGSLANLLSKPDVLAAVSMISQISQGGGIGFGQVSFIHSFCTYRNLSSIFPEQTGLVKTCKQQILWKKILRQSFGMHRCEIGGGKVY